MKKWPGPTVSRKVLVLVLAVCLGIAAGAESAYACFQFPGTGAVLYCSFAGICPFALAGCMRMTCSGGGCIGQNSAQQCYYLGCIFAQCGSCPP